MQQHNPAGRIREIDIAKGMACFLMLVSHLQRGGLLPAGTFAAALFFACSGMNVILLIEKTRGNRCFDLFHLLFPVILFFGGVTQIVIARGGTLRILPEFLQFIALAILAVFALGRLFSRPRRCGWLFPIPFLVQQLLPSSILESAGVSPWAFVIGHGFSLFPWLGFVLFGIFILALERRPYRWLQAALVAGFVLSHGVLGIPLEKFRMTLPYILLALLAVTVFFSLGRLLGRSLTAPRLRPLAELFALPGRNSLMFVYLHYFARQFFASRDLVPSAYLMLLLESAYLFALCFCILKFYEKVKEEQALLAPALALGLALAVVRWAGWLRPHSDVKLIDMLIGILFAFLYVLLRRRAAAWCGRDGARGG